MSSFNPGPGSTGPVSVGYNPLPGIFGGGPILSYTPYYQQGMAGNRPDSFQLQNGKPVSKPSKLQTIFKEIAKTGVVIGASVLGGLVGGVPGAMVAGAAAGGLVSVADQKLSKGRVNWGSALIDTAIGLIPAGLGGGVIKGLETLTGKAFFNAVGRQGVKPIIAKGATIGAIDGAAISYASGVGHSAMDSYQQTGAVNWQAANKAGMDGIVAGAVGGAVAGGAVNGLVHHFSAKSGQKALQKERAKAAHPDAHTPFGITPPTAAELANLQPPRRSLFNRAMAMIGLKSEDAMLGNLHTVDSHVLRGAMPESAEAFAHLKAKHNVQTIIDLRGPGTTKAAHIQFELGHAQQNGIRYLHLPMNSHIPPTQAELQKFMQAIQQTQQNGGKVYVHCKHGIDRTGALIGAYEVLKGATPEAAFKRMRQYGYNLQHEWSRPAQKNFILGDGLLQTMKQAEHGAQLRTQAFNLRSAGSISQRTHQKIIHLLNTGRIAEAAQKLDLLNP